MFISEMRLKIGASEKAPPLILNSPTCTVFVGPNNSGKSVILREIANASSGSRNVSTLILDDIFFTPHSNEEAREILDAWRVVPQPGEAVGAENAILKHGPCDKRCTCRTS